MIKAEIKKAFVKIDIKNIKTQDQAVYEVATLVTAIYKTMQQETTKELAKNVMQAALEIVQEHLKN